MKAIIGNWKMYFSHNQAKEWIEKNTSELITLSENTDHLIALCPSFTMLPYATDALKESKIKIGAQDCSAHSQGAYTGQISARSISELGCEYVIIGHSETRKYFQFSDEIIRLKIKEALSSNLIPIICIGETMQERENNQEKEIIKNQLTSIIQSVSSSDSNFFVAYEPIWAIGSGKTPSIAQLESMFTLINTLLKDNNLTGTLLYGGSVNAQNVASFAQIQLINGFLIGGASTDFQELKKIVSLV